MATQGVKQMGDRSEDVNPDNSTVAPVDLPQLKVWLASLASDYANAIADEKPRLWKKKPREPKDRQDQVNALSLELSGLFHEAKTEDALRRLLAAGIIRYVKGSKAELADIQSSVAVTIVQDIVGLALWSVVQTPDLPSDWESSLAQITSPRMAALVAQARSEGVARETAGFEAFCRTLAQRSMSRGTLNLMDDFSDPRRGGPALTALALTAQLSPPGKSQGAKKVIAWTIAAAVGGAASAEGAGGAAEINHLAMQVWNSLVDPEMNSMHHSVNAATTVAGVANPVHGHHQHGAHVQALHHVLRNFTQN
jgi:hypothetical protein